MRFWNDHDVSPCQVLGSCYRYHRGKRETVGARALPFLFTYLISVYRVLVPLLDAANLIVNKKGPVTCLGLVRERENGSPHVACILNNKQMCQCIYEIIVNCNKFYDNHQIESYG